MRYVKDLTELKTIVADPKVYLGDLDISEINSLDYLFVDDNPFKKSATRSDFSGIEKWNVSKVESAVGTFAFLENFNQDLSKWDLQNCKNTSMMFLGCTNLNQDFSNWSLPQVENITKMFDKTPLNGDLGEDARLPLVCRAGNFAVVEKNPLAVLGEIDALFIPKQAIQKFGNQIILEFKEHKENYPKSKFSLHIYPDLVCQKKMYEYHVLEYSKNRISLSKMPIALLEAKQQSEHFKLYDSFSDYLNKRIHKPQNELFNALKF